MSRRRPSALVALVALVPVAAAAGRSTARPAPPVELVWHVEAPDGRTIESRGADGAINPASVVKVATSLAALEQLGPDFRFETRLCSSGTIDASAKTLRGDLVVDGGGDPDFQPENAFLVAAELNALGIRRVSGALVVDHDFWIGWEGGSARRLADPERRARRMADRLRRALDPQLWEPSTRRSWNLRAAAWKLDPAHPPRVAVEGGIGVGEVTQSAALLIHRSNPLAPLLRRFNSYSNNDIERFDLTLGPPAELADWTAARLGAPAGALSFETSSGLGENRMTPRQVVALVRRLDERARSAGIVVDDVLPAAGCGPGTVSRFFPRLRRTPGALVGKTGTLVETDGGVAVLAGIVRTASGPLVFCVAAPHAGRTIFDARRAEERWLVELTDRHGGPALQPCVGPLAGSADRVEIVRGVWPGADPSPVGVSAAPAPSGLE